jgi:glycosyltransferase involved in cell wall biosynthesis
MPDPSPTISVCMPVFNAEQYVRQAAESVLAQTFGDFEFIIIDDGSTDDSHAILEELARRDPRIRLISRPNTGYTRALNEALGLARGTYIARMDADDVSMPDRFRLQVEYLRGRPECVLVGSRIMMIDPFGIELFEPDHRLVHEEIDQQLLNGIGWAVVHPVAMMVRERVMALGGYRPEMEPSEDLDLFLRLAEHGRIANLPQVLLHYRQHIKSVNHTRCDEQNEAARRIIIEAYNRRGTGPPPGWTPPERELFPVRKEINMWAWQALRSGHIAAARRHALSLLRIAPFSVGSWRLMYCAIRGH